ncbi:MAG: hypothetical protein MUO95_02235 [Methanoregula sp.]|nr:hypothetical protein [Methanoregula sp.]
MNTRTISSLILPWILARLPILVKAVTSIITTGKMVAVPSLANPDTTPAGTSPAIPFHPRHMSKNKTLIKGG